MLCRSSTGCIARLPSSFFGRSRASGIKGACLHVLGMGTTRFIGCGCPRFQGFRRRAVRFFPQKELRDRALVDLSANEIGRNSSGASCSDFVFFSVRGTHKESTTSRRVNSRSKLVFFDRDSIFFDRGPHITIVAPISRSGSPVSTAVLMRNARGVVRWISAIVFQRS